MRLCVIGTGYVGLVAGTCLAEMGNDVICVDNDVDKIDRLKKGEIPIYEPNLEELIKVNITEKRLQFTNNLDFAVKNSTVCFIAVGTPQREDGSCDLSAVFNVAKSIAVSMNEYKVIVDKSTVPVGTAQEIAKIIKAHTKENFDVVSNPEFLKQGGAVEDFLKPDRVIIGSNSSRATEILQEIYSPFLRTGNPVIVMDVKSAEMTKYAANSFLAAKISFINEISNICECMGADIDKVRIGISTDKRIGGQFLFPGLGYGGSCFPKDVKALVSMSKDNGFDANLLKTVDKVNQFQRHIFIEKILKYFHGNLSEKELGIWGLAFKPKTNDMREAPAIDIIDALLANGAKVRVYDPKAMETAYSIWGEKIHYYKNCYDVIEGADALLLLTEWNEFRRPDFDKVKWLLKSPVIFDGRNQYEPQRMLERGFTYINYGRERSNIIPIKN